MADAKRSNRSKKNRKHGRNSNFCKAYRNSNRREKNKVKAIRKHLENHPQDVAAKSAFERLRDAIRGIDFRGSEE